MTVQRTLERIDLLRSEPIFGGLKPSTLELLLDESDQQTYCQDEYFFRKGEQGEYVFVLESGTALVERLWNDTPIILGRLHPGDCFGEMSLIDFQCRSASVKAETECVALKIPFSALRHLYQSSLEEYTMVMLNLGREVSRRLRIAGDRLFRFQQELGRQWFDDELTGDA